MKFVKDSSKHAKRSHIRMLLRIINGIEIECVSGGNVFFVYKVMRVVESSIKSCENLL